MEWAREAAAKRQFEGFAAEASDTLLRTGYLMTGDARNAEDLVQETFLRVARRWNQVRAVLDAIVRCGRLAGDLNNAPDDFVQVVGRPTAISPSQSGS
jgi:Sigma-70 region 2